jgi:hypothetical protein
MLQVAFLTATSDEDRKRGLVAAIKSTDVFEQGKDELNFISNGERHRMAREAQGRFRESTGRDATFTYEQVPDLMINQVISGNARVQSLAFTLSNARIDEAIDAESKFKTFYRETRVVRVKCASRMYALNLASELSRSDLIVQCRFQDVMPLEDCAAICRSSGKTLVWIETNEDFTDRNVIVISGAPVMGTAGRWAPYMPAGVYWVESIQEAFDAGGYVVPESSSPAIALRDFLAHSIPDFAFDTVHIDGELVKAQAQNILLQIPRAGEYFTSVTPFPWLDSFTVFWGDVVPRVLDVCPVAAMSWDVRDLIMRIGVSSNQDDNNARIVSVFRRLKDGKFPSVFTDEMIYKAVTAPDVLGKRNVMIDSLVSMGAETHRAVEAVDALSSLIERFAFSDVVSTYSTQDNIIGYMDLSLASHDRTVSSPIFSDRSITTVLRSLGILSILTRAYRRQGYPLPVHATILTDGRRFKATLNSLRARFKRRVSFDTVEYPETWF